MKIFFLIILFFSTAQSQTVNNLHTPEKIRKFADYLFFEKDYLRSAFEYEKLPANDTVQFKIALAYQAMEKYEAALEKFSAVRENSIYYEESQKEYFKTMFQAGEYEQLQKKISNIEERNSQRLIYLSYLFTSNELPEQQSFLKIFPSAEQERLQYFYNHKKEPPYKSSLLSGIMSALVPGSGKIYLGSIGDGITAFLATSLLAFLSYDNFSHNHNFRGWLFSGLGFFFYAGNIYGSTAAAEIYNSKVDYEYDSDLKEYLRNKNYFLPPNDFTK